MSDPNPIQPHVEGRTIEKTVTVVDQRAEEPLQPAVASDVRTTVRKTNTVAQDPHLVISRRIRRSVVFVVNLIAILITLRIVLALLGANPESLFATFIYTITGVLTLPFQGLFGTSTPPTLGVPTFEASSLVAISIYYLIGWIALRVQSLSDQRSATTRTEVTDRETRVDM